MVTKSQNTNSQQSNAKGKTTHVLLKGTKKQQAPEMCKPGAYS